MKGFVSKEKFNDLLFYKWMLDQGITEFTGGVKEAFEATWDFHRHLFDRKEAGVATKLELAALEQFELLVNNYIDNDEAGD